MFRIKICGITNLDDALAVARAGADAIGLNFYPASPRCIDPRQARDICRALPPEMVKVGVFVNAAEIDVRRTVDELRLDLIQLHGDEPPEFIARLDRGPVMRAFRVGQQGLKPIFDYLDCCRRLGCMPKLVLLDAYVKGVYGGSGDAADWSVCAQYPLHEDLPPLVLAGGLNPSNVAQAIHQVQPAAVDAASGVESSPGKKDLASVANFVQTARESFDNS